MSLMKRGGVYWTYFYIDGVRHQMSTGTGNRRQAQDIANRLREEENLRRFQVANYNPHMTFGELAAHFLAKGKVRAHHVGRLDFLLPYFSEIPISQIDKGAVTKYRQARHDDKQVSESTVNRDVEVLRHILFWAVDEEHLLPTNPIARIRLERERRKRRPVISVAEELKLIDAASPHLRQIIIAALDTGMRRGEILAQCWDGVDFERRLLSVTKSKTPEGEAREIPLTHRMFDLLSIEQQRTGSVFTFQGEPIKAIKTAWKNAIRRAQIPWYRFHDLRHAFNTRLLEANVMQEVRKALMGHSSGEDINATYTHIEMPMKRRAIANLEAWHNRQIQQHKGGPTNGLDPKALPAGVVGLLSAGTGNDPEPDQ